MKYFNTLELNSTFYHIPKETTIRKWNNNLPDDFVLSIKANRNMTHIKRLKNIEIDLKGFVALISPLKKKLGVTLFQLPPSLKKDIILLKEFSYLLKNYRYKFAIEFKHKSWLDSDIYEILKENNIAFCISDGSESPYVEIVTANFAYIRLHGHEMLYASKYSNSALKEYKEKINKFNKSKISCYVYFNNDFGGFAIENAMTLRKFLETSQ